MSSFDYVNRQYQLALRRGSEFEFDGRPVQAMSATGHIHVRFLDGKKPRYGWLHPRWKTIYPASVERHPKAGVPTL